MVLLSSSYACSTGSAQKRRIERHTGIFRGAAASTSSSSCRRVALPTWKSGSRGQWEWLICQVISGTLTSIFSPPLPAKKSLKLGLDFSLGAEYIRGQGMGKSITTFARLAGVGVCGWRTPGVEMMLHGGYKLSKNFFSANSSTAIFVWFESGNKGPSWVIHLFGDINRFPDSMPYLESSLL